jgi:hypothetical protein
MVVANKLQESTNLIQKRQADNNAKKNEMERERMEMDVMEKDVSNMDNLAKKYFLMKKRKILCECQEREKQESEKKKEKDVSHQSWSDYQSSKQDPDQELQALDESALYPELQESALHSESQTSVLHSELLSSFPDEETFLGRTVDPSLQNL